ncbi:hypothetical protein ABTF55_19945, partial [Acinetobacter baumannii]
IPVSGAVKDFVISAVSQGCADKGLCYPPMTLKLAMSAQDIGKSVAPVGVNADVPGAGGSDIDGIAAVLKGGKLWSILSLFFLLGIGLSFTPC